MEELIKIIPGERFTPYGLAKKLDARCILESSSYQKGRERYSLLMVREAFRVSQDSRGIFFTSSEDFTPAGGDSAKSPLGIERIEAGKEYRIQSKARDILDLLLYFANQHKQPHQDFPYPAGGIGFLSFEFSRFCDTIPLRTKPDPLGLPDGLFLFGHVFIVFDHYTDLLYLIGLNYREKSIDLVRALAEVEDTINDLNFSYLKDDETLYPAVKISGPEIDEEYKEFVEAMRKEVVLGNLLQGVPSRRLQYKTDLPGIEAYRRLRRTNPSPYLFYLNFGDFELFGASPEVHCKVKEDRALVRPIAGTRRRSPDKAKDLALEHELLSDPKERAEHLMLVDLGRNDLGRVCSPGSVAVSEYMVIERYSHVMHIVSQVEGTLAPEKNGLDVLRATFPAGTVSGAPKIQAIKTIDRLERVQRRFYAGVVGYIEPGGNLDTCITIRSALKKDGVLTLQAGGGIVFDSTPERELEETNEKLGALLRSIGAEASQEVTQ
ncbi:MAG: anthranilate synthase component I [Spirochaetales bacterium]|nr:anthranilate synthase component I [Spirochaetales bacterium]